MIKGASGEILVISPHPDDESIGAPATLLNLQESGFQVVNYAASLGKPEQYDRRSGELSEACARAAFELIIPEHPARISSGDDMVTAQGEIAEAVSSLIHERRPIAVVSPSVHDGHHGHEVVARATRDGIEASGMETRWFMYNIWGDLPFPNVYSAFHQNTLDKVQHILGAYEGENDRNNYQNMVLGRAILGAVLGSEKVFGFGSAAASTEPYAELLTEAVYTDGVWKEGAHRVLDKSDPFRPAPLDKPLEWWIDSTSPYQTHREL